MDPDSAPAVDRVPHGGSDDPDLLDFSANSNPEIPPGTRSVYADALEESRSYPNDDYPEFRREAAEYVGCGAGQVVPTPGGLAAIRLTVGVTVGPGDEVLVPAPSFAEYAREVRLQGARPAFVPHDELLDADPTEYALAIACNPNNPTGEAYPPESIRRFADRCRAAGTALLVDEAFLGFTTDPSMAGRPGVVVARSLTKLFGLPGLRAGFGVLPDEPAGSGDRPDNGPDDRPDNGPDDRLRRARRTWALGTPAAAVGAHAMGREEFVERTRGRVTRERERMYDRLDERFSVHRSAAPFLLIDVGEDPTDLVEHCLERGIAIRDATSFRGLDQHVRVAVRLPGENDRLLEALDV